MQIFLPLLSDPRFQIGVGKYESIHRATVNKTVKFKEGVIREKCFDQLKRRIQILQ
nr:unnamed protein product [Callosobruchus analis]